MDPDELYTLRAQYWLGHYQLALEEAKSISRRPMPPQLKVEREELVLRSLLAKGEFEKVIQGSDGADKGLGIQAINIRAKYELTDANDTATRKSYIAALQSLLNNDTATPTVQIIAAQTFLMDGEMTNDALSAVHLGTTLEQLALVIQIYIRMDRLDLAQETLAVMKSSDEEAVLTQMSSVHVMIANGRSTAPDAIHIMSSLSEQYGNSTTLLNLTACAYMTAGRYAEAEQALLEAKSEGSSLDTLINLMVCSQHLGKGMAAIAPLVMELKQQYPSCSFVNSLNRVEGAFDREALKYKVTA